MTETEKQIERLEKAIEQVQYKVIWCSKGLDKINTTMEKQNLSWSIFRVVVVVLLFWSVLIQLSTCQNIKLIH